MRAMKNDANEALKSIMKAQIRRFMKNDADGGVLSMKRRRRVGARVRERLRDQEYVKTRVEVDNEGGDSGSDG
ncbi:hypothetical protein V2J09_004883 [Rumex salicifolius]